MTTNDRIPIIKNDIIMSEKSKIKRARKEAKQEKDGKNVVAWIFGGLIVIAIISMIWTFAAQ